MIHARSILGTLLIGSLVAAGAAADGEPGPQVDEPFPHTLAAPDQRGEAQTVASLMGEKGLAVLFVRSADWCPFCRGQLADANEHLDRFREHGVAVVSVSVDDVEETAKFAAAAGIRYTMLADPAGAINESLGIRDEQYPVGSARSVCPGPRST